MKYLIALLTLCFSATVLAGAYGESGLRPEDVTGNDSTTDKVLDRVFGSDNPPPPPEQAFTKPALADLKLWQQFNASYTLRNNDYYIALDSLSVGQDDGIVRYAAAVLPKRGKLKNISFEGIDCKSRQYRVYAYGDETGKKWIDGNQRWKRLVKNQRNAYQGEFYDVMCNGGTAYPVPEIDKQLRDTDKQPGDCLGCRSRG
ncbi:CNP1-like family protein [Chitiniphilus eburneus]|uniref:CNP1-like uncharacterized domain-containing protein n=1 Tax=Chitiniphilus eburneus TaxID=2571148 RepID=A0A4U0QMX4_9NEIS|nr:CNP1-like family protein [Chitiniphilus eburneus]TJZ77454.1 hypothetical protein FAZ21_03715 [Chitiniphilus eburneus]